MISSLLFIASHPNFPLYEDLLSPGWLPGRTFVDVSDHQWRSFRNNLPLAIIFFSLYLLISYLGKLFTRRHLRDTLNEKLRFQTLLSVGGLFLLHGFNMFKILFLLLINFTVGKLVGGRKGPLPMLCTWIVALGMLLFLEFFTASECTSLPSIAFIDRFLFRWWRGVFSRWHVTFNITILRCISFNLDWHWNRAPLPNSTSPLSHQETCSHCANRDANNKNSWECPRFRIQQAPPDEYFNWQAYLAYCLYLPLYLAGPIITFNDFIHQVDHLLTSKRSRALLWYGFRWICVMLLMEGLSHYFYVVAIKTAQAWNNFEPVDFVILAYLNLKMVWLKLLLIWRFFRLIAWVDGVETIENMERCMSNTHSGLAFWRAWHRSFNQWVIRYLYIPLGGKSTVAWNVWIIFSWVAIWHDLRLRLFLWSWLICLLLVPELTLRWLSQKGQWEERLGYKWYRQGEAIAAGANIFLMGLANLVGFVLGWDGLGVALRSFLSIKGFLTECILAWTLWAVGHVQLQIRKSERQLGIEKNY